MLRYHYLSDSLLAGTPSPNFFDGEISYFHVVTLVFSSKLIELIPTVRLLRNLIKRNANTFSRNAIVDVRRRLRRRHDMILFLISRNY